MESDAADPSTAAPEPDEHRRSGQYTVIIGRSQLLQRFACRLVGISTEDRDQLLSGLTAIEEAARGLAGFDRPLDDRLPHRARG